MSAGTPITPAPRQGQEDCWDWTASSAAEKTWISGSGGDSASKKYIESDKGHPTALFYPLHLTTHVQMHSCSTIHTHKKSQARVKVRSRICNMGSRVHKGEGGTQQGLDLELLGVCNALPLRVTELWHQCKPTGRSREQHNLNWNRLIITPDSGSMIFWGVYSSIFLLPALCEVFLFV